MADLSHFQHGGKLIWQWATGQFRWGNKTKYIQIYSYLDLDIFLLYYPKTWRLDVRLLIYRNWFIQTYNNLELVPNFLIKPVEVICWHLGEYGGFPHFNFLQAGMLLNFELRSDLLTISLSYRSHTKLIWGNCVFLRFSLSYWETIYKIRHDKSRNNTECRLIEKHLKILSCSVYSFCKSQPRVEIRTSNLVVINQPVSLTGITFFPKI